MGDRYHRKYNPRASPENSFTRSQSKRMQLTQKSGKLQISKASRKVGFFLEICLKLFG